MTSKPHESSGRLRNGSLLLVGLYLIGGSAYTLYSGQWFAGFPPQLDVFGTLPFGNLMEATVGGLLGVVAVVVAVYRRRRAGRE